MDRICSPCCTARRTGARADLNRRSDGDVLPRSLVSAVAFGVLLKVLRRLRLGPGRRRKEARLGTVSRPAGNLDWSDEKRSKCNSTSPASWRGAIVCWCFVPAEKWRPWVDREMQWFLKNRNKDEMLVGDALPRLQGPAGASRAVPHCPQSPPAEDLARPFVLQTSRLDAIVG